MTIEPETTAALDLEELRTMIADVIDVDVAEVTDDATFADDLEVDSLLALELAVQFENHYGVKVAEDEIAQFTDLRATHRLLAGKMAGV
ncbi:acyl carrier protein [Jidongwangia harbinensis]|uniref:acyl carrier protein n=1 Tax=Jidongwangia harbinensis TaxID=2878561 RepID=UPI001CD996FE|nr:acyl carrier protein [Jidongwangia harbinensis]MCA2215092.1 acyl carrier protein [Jidongwangia harbinensis]